MVSLSDDIIKYKKGELSPEQMHALEKKALSDPFLAEALEGIEIISTEELVQDVSAIQSKIAARKQTNLFTPLRIAAGIAMLVGSVFLIYEFAPKPKTLALKTENQKPENKIEENANPAIESERLKVESDEKVEKRKEPMVSNVSPPSSLNPSVNAHQQASPQVQQPEPGNQNSAGAQSLSQPSPVQSLASSEVQQDADLKITDDQQSSKSEDREQAAGAKSIDKKRNSYAEAKAERAVAPSSLRKAIPSISGQVVSADGSPLPGVKVAIKGTTNGTVTDANGNFSLPADPKNQSLVFSFIGFQMNKVDINGQNKSDVRLKEDVSPLSEVVVTGMGAVKDTDHEPAIILAEPIGGRKAYDNYLESNLNYPDAALKNNINGKAGIEFTVGTDGSLSDFRVTKKLGYGCEEEIIRLVKSGPSWSPTKEDSKPIESTVRVWLKFDPAKARK